MSTMKLGEFLIQNRYIASKELEEALYLQKKYRKQKLGRLLVELENLSPKELNKALTDYFKLINLSSENLKVLELKGQVERANPRPEMKHLAQKHKALVLREDSHKVEFLRVKEVDDSLLSKAEELTGKDAFCHIIPKETFDFLSPVQLPAQRLIRTLKSSSLMPLQMMKGSAKTHPMPSSLKQP